MDPRQLVEEVHRRRARAHDVPGLRVFWVTLAEDRDKFIVRLRRTRGNFPLVPVILRRPGLFSDPNAVMNDVTTIISDARDDIIGMKKYAQEHNCVDLIVLSRSELALTVTASPLQLPEWFPVMPGRTVAAHIDDLTWSVHVSLSDGVVAQNDLRRLLYEVDVALLSRIQETLLADYRKVQGLWGCICREGENDIAPVLQDIGKRLGHIKNSYEFRPSTSKNPTLVGRLWFEANKTSPDKLPRVAKALACALRANEPSAATEMASLMAVLNRPTSPITDVGTRWSFLLIVTLRSACQLVTAAAHADEYPMFPDVLLRATSLDFRRFLDESVQSLRS